MIGFLKYFIIFGGEGKEGIPTCCVDSLATVSLTNRHKERRLGSALLHRNLFRKFAQKEMPLGGFTLCGGGPAFRRWLTAAKQP